MHHHMDLGPLPAGLTADPVSLLEGITRSMGQRPELARAFPLPDHGLAGAWMRPELQIVYRVGEGRHVLSLDVYARQAEDLNDALRRLETLFQVVS